MMGRPLVSYDAKIRFTKFSAVSIGTCALHPPLRRLPSDDYSLLLPSASTTTRMQSRTVNSYVLPSDIPSVDSTRRKPCRRTHSDFGGDVVISRSSDWTVLVDGFLGVNVVIF